MQLDLSLAGSPPHPPPDLHPSLHLPPSPSPPLAGFHNASLYPALRPAVPPLVALLSDEEDRTRANAAGALGNLVRNSGQLCRDIVGAGALRAMLDLIQRRDGSPGADGTGAGGSSSSVQIALFSLGNLCAHADCADALVQLGLRDALAAVLRDRGDDATVQRYVARIQQKLAARRGGGG